MFEFLWECLSISYKGFLGMLFWSIGVGLFGFAIAVIGFALSGEWKTKKKKYEGQPIVLKGGKKDE